MADFKVDPKAFYIVGTPFVTHDDRSYRKGARVLGSDEYVGKLGENFFVPESEATSDALAEAYQRNWDATMAYKSQERAVAALVKPQPKPIKPEDAVVCIKQDGPLGGPTSVTEDGEPMGCRVGELLS